MAYCKKGYNSWNKGLTKETDKRVKAYSKKLLGREVSEETRRKLRGRVHTEETKRKISEANKGNIAWNKGMPCSEETKQKIRETEQGNIPWNKGLRMDTDDRVRKYGEANKGEKCHFWKGGITPLYIGIRLNYKYRQWRDDVYTKDDFTCQECGKRGTYLEAHHIQTLSSILQYYEITTLEEALECSELWNINNGITLCKECHRKVHKKVINNGTHSSTDVGGYRR